VDHKTGPTFLKFFCRLTKGAAIDCPIAFDEKLVRGLRQCFRNARWPSDQRDLRESRIVAQVLRRS
jgi:hypothetical protein